ncbi:MAG: PEGA domain-containing protein [Treponema sp.]
MKQTVSFFLLLVMVIAMVSSCVTRTNVIFNTDVAGADVYVDGEHIGKTPVTKSLSNAVWEDPDILIKKDGYQDMYLGVKKEVKVVNLVCGLLLWWPSLLWVYGPTAHQHYLLSPTK